MDDRESALSDFEKAVEKDISIPDSKKDGYSRAILSLALLECGKVKEAHKGKKMICFPQISHQHSLTL